MTKRPCRTDPEAFFPPAGQIEAVREAQARCLRCPFLGQCALEAVPLVQAREMADCVIAAVHLPKEEALRGEWTRNNAVAQLLAVAAASKQREAGAA